MCFSRFGRAALSLIPHWGQCRTHSMARGLASTPDIAPDFRRGVAYPRQVPRAKCAERNGYLPRHHFPRAWRLCPPNLAGEPPFAAPRGRSLDISNYEPSPESCQEKRDQARINLDAPQADILHNLSQPHVLPGDFPCKLPGGRLKNANPAETASSS